jgi:NADH-quinone oxidoreductase subunit M
MNVPYILSLITYLPAAAALLLLCLPGSSEKLLKSGAFLSSALTFVISLHCVYHFDAAEGHMQFETSAVWIQTAAFSIRHHMGMDGISLFLVILTTFLTPLPSFLPGIP